MNRPARFTAADLRRAAKVAEQMGPDWAVEIDPDGKIRVVRRPDARSTQRAIAEAEEVVF